MNILSFVYRARLILGFIVVLSLYTMDSSAQSNAREVPKLLDKYFKQVIRYPQDPNIIDVTKAPYRADKSGRKDNTKIFQRLMQDIAKTPDQPVVIYLPKGTYLVSDTIAPPQYQPREGKPDGKARCYITWQGESTEGTVIQLMDRAKGYESDQKPKAVITTTLERWNNDGFQNNLFNLTIDVGKGNPGAMALTYIGNNASGIRDVHLRSRDPRSGYIGLDMLTRTLPGPALVKRLRVTGFQYGIYLGAFQYGITFEDIHLLGQSKYGAVNDRNMMAMRRLYSEGSVTAIHNKHEEGMLVAVDIIATKAKAIENVGILYTKNVKGQGQHFKENTTGPVISPFNGPKKMLGLKVEETPEVPWGDPSTWVNVGDFRPPNKHKFGDDSQTIQRAIDSMKGKQVTLFFPTGLWIFNGPVKVRGNVVRIVGPTALFHITSPYGKSGKPVFIIEKTKHPVLILEQMRWNWSETKSACYKYENRRDGVLIFRNVFAPKGPVYKGLSNAKVYIEDMHGLYGDLWGGAMDIKYPLFHFGKREQVWARQFNPEGAGQNVWNDGGKLWIFGFKTEHRGTMITTKNRGETEVYGGIIHDTNLKIPAKEMPCFIVDNSKASIIVMQPATTNNKPDWKYIVKEIQGRRTKDVMQKDCPTINNGQSFVLPMYTSKR